MSASVAIGEFSRLTHLTVKTLRHYHEQGLLVPYAVDEQSGYRRYSVDQVPAALLIGRLRALDMPLADVRRVVECSDSRERDAVIAQHLRRMELELDRRTLPSGSARLPGRRRPAPGRSGIRCREMSSAAIGPPPWSAPSRQWAR